MIRALWTHYFWDVWFPFGPSWFHFYQENFDFCSSLKKILSFKKIYFLKIESLELENWNFEKLKLRDFETWDFGLKFGTWNLNFWNFCHLKFWTWDFEIWDFKRFETWNLQLVILKLEILKFWDLKIETWNFEILNWKFGNWERKFWIENLGFGIWKFCTLNLNLLSLICSKNFFSSSLLFLKKKKMIWPFSFHDVIFFEEEKKRK